MPHGDVIETERRRSNAFCSTYAILISVELDKREWRNEFGSGRSYKLDDNSTCFPKRRRNWTAIRRKVTKHQNSFSTVLKPKTWRCESPSRQNRRSAPEDSLNRALRYVAAETAAFPSCATRAKKRPRILAGVGSRVFEIALEHGGNAFRAIYAVQIGEDVQVVDAFQKRSKSGIKTPRMDADRSRNASND